MSSNEILPISGDRSSRLRTAHEYVQQTLRHAILDGKLRGGTRLVQAEIATQLGVSTTPVREAMRDLATEGLIIFDPHRGAMVRILNQTEIDEVYELRAALEPLRAPRAAALVTEEVLERAGELIRDMEDQTDPSRWVESNRAFHALFDDLGDGSRLASILDGLRNSAATFVGISLDKRPDQMMLANIEHLALLEAYRARDVPRIIELTLSHFESTRAILHELPASADQDSASAGDTVSGGSA